MADRFWVGGTGTWVAGGTTKWSTTSGGGSGATVPSASDRAIFDANSGGGTVTLSGALTCLDLLMNGATSSSAWTGTLTSTGTITISGSVELSASGTYNNTGTWTLNATASKTFKSAGKTIANSVTFSGAAGSWQLQDNFTTGAALTVTLTQGTLDLNGKTMSTGLFSSSNSNTRAITAGGGNITLTNTGANTIWTTSTVTGFSLTNALQVNVTGSTASTRTITTGTLSEANSPSFAISAGSGSVVTSSTASIKNLDYTGFAGSTSGGRTLYGNLTIVAGMTYSGNITMAATSGTQTITTNGNTGLTSLTINGVGGTTSLGDNWTATGSGALTLTNGTFTANDKDINIGSVNFSNSNTRTLTMGLGTWTLTSTGSGITWTATTTTGLTFNKGTGLIKFVDTSTNVSGATFSGGGLTYNNISFEGNANSTGGVTINQSNTFNNFNITHNDPLTVQASIKKLILANATTQHVASFTVPDSGNNRFIGLGNVTNFSTLTLSGGGVVSVANMNIQGITASGGSWYAYFSQNLGNNSGWIFESVGYPQRGAMPMQAVNRAGSY